MKRLFLTYLCCIVLAFALPALLAGFSKREGYVVEPPEKASPESGRLPKEIKVYFSDEGVTRSIGLEEYIKGVLPAEMPASFEAEALKAQAVAARTYAYYKYLKYQNASSAPAEHLDAVICTNPSHCNAYYSPLQLTEKHGKEWADKNLERLRGYVDETKGEILVFKDEPILAVFHSASAGGFTESSGDVWEKELPYLVSVKSEGEEHKNGYISSVSVSHEEFKEKIISLDNQAKFPPNYKSWIGKSELTTANHIKSLIIGGVALKGTQIRSAFGLKSTCFEVTIDEDNVIFTVKGSGHGVGMSQYGANYMAQKGAKYKDILESYYKGAVVEK